MTIPIGGGSPPPPVPGGGDPIPPGGSVNNVQDFFLTPDQLATLYSTSDTSFLPASDMTLFKFFDVLAKNKVDFQKQIKKSEATDQDTQANAFSIRLDQAFQLLLLYQLRQQMATSLPQLFSSIKSSTQTMNTATTAFNTYTANANSGTAINTFNSQVSAFNTVANNTNTVLSNPNSTQAQKDTAIGNYNSAVNTLNGQIDTFNGKLTESSNAANTYQNAVNAYNLQASLNNVVIDVVNANLRKRGLLPIDSQPLNSNLLTNFSAGPLGHLSGVSGTPASVPTSGLNGFNYLTVYSTNAYPQITVPSSLLFVDFFITMVQIFLPALLDLFNQEVFSDSSLKLAADMNDRRWGDPNVNKYSVLPKSYYSLHSGQPATVNANASGGMSTAVSNIGLGAKGGQIDTALNKATFKQILESADPNNPNIENIIKQLLLLLMSSLIMNSQGAVSDSLETLNPSLASLSPAPNSPSLTVVAALSAYNQNLKTLNPDSIKTLISQLISEDPSLSKLTEAQKKDLTTQLSGEFSITIMTLLVKILCEALGLPEFLAQVLGTIPELADDIPKVATGDEPPKTTEANKKIKDELEQSFIDKGFSAEEAKFLAQVGFTSYANAYIQPKSTVVTPETTNLTLAKDSLAAQLLLDKDLNLDLASAKELAGKIIDKTLAEGETARSGRFREDLINNLVQNNVGLRDAEIISSNVLLIPNEEPKLKETVQPITVKGETTNQFNLLPIDELIALLQKRTLELLGPELGTEGAKAVAAQIVDLLFGPLPEKSTGATEERLQNPSSFIRLVGAQINDSKLTQQEDVRKVFIESFRDYIKSATDLNVSLLKVLDPATIPLMVVSLMYQEHTSQIGLGQSRSTPVDIPA